MPYAMVTAGWPFNSPTATTRPGRGLGPGATVKSSGNRHHNKSPGVGFGNRVVTLEQALRDRHLALRYALPDFAKHFGADRPVIRCVLGEVLGSQLSEREMDDLCF